MSQFCMGRLWLSPESGLGVTAESDVPGHPGTHMLFTSDSPERLESNLLAFALQARELAQSIRTDYIKEN